MSVTSKSLDLQFLKTASISGADMTSGWTGVNVSLSSSDFGGTLGEKSLTLTNAKKIIVT